MVLRGQEDAHQEMLALASAQIVLQYVPKALYIRCSLPRPTALSKRTYSQCLSPSMRQRRKAPYALLPRIQGTAAKHLCTYGVSSTKRTASLLGGDVKVVKRAVVLGRFLVFPAGFCYLAFSDFASLSATVRAAVLLLPHICAII